MSQFSDRVRRVIDNAEAAYERCWNILAGIKRGTAGLAIGDFQPTLAEALLALSREYGFVSQVRTKLIQQKATSHPRRFANRPRAGGGDWTGARRFICLVLLSVRS